MSYTFIPNLTKQEHDAFLKDHPLATLSQESRWGEVKSEWEKQYVGLKVNNTLVASAQVFIRKLPLGLSMVYIARGPLLDYNNQEIVQVFFTHLKNHYKRVGRVMIKFDPPIVIKKSTYSNYEYEPNYNHPIIETLSKVGAQFQGFDRNLYRYAQPRYLSKLNKEVALQQGYSKSATRNIKHAQKKGVEIEQISLDELSRFSSIIEYTENRKNIGLRNHDYFKRIYTAFLHDSYVIMAFLNQRKQLEETTKKIEVFQEKLSQSTKNSSSYNKINDQLQSAMTEKKRLEANIQQDGDVVDIAGLYALRTHRSVDLLYMGLNEKYRKYRAPHYIYDAAIEWAFEQGIEVVDFGGMAGTLDDGLSEFKSSFNADVVEMIGEFDIVLSPMLYKLYLKGWPKLKKMMLFIKRKET